MFSFKAAYFYLYAVKITLVNFLRNIYFTTNYYNKSLITKLPERLHFYPNPFLLSSFVDQKNFTFKLSQVNIGNFWTEHLNKKEEKEKKNQEALNREKKNNVDNKFLVKFVYSIPEISGDKKF